MKKLTVSTFLASMSGALVLAAAVGLSPAKLASAVTEVDTVAPTVYVLSPSNGAVIDRNSSVEITQEAYDNVGVTRLVYEVKNDVLCDGLVGSCIWTPTKKGMYTVSVTAYDAAGNNSTSSVSVTVK